MGCRQRDLSPDRRYNAPFLLVSALSCLLFFFMCGEQVNKDEVDGKSVKF